MERISVGASKKYEVVIGRGLLDRCGELVSEVKPACRTALITDDIVDGLYADRTEQSLREAGFSVSKYVFPHGEQSKDLKNYERILEFLLKEGLSRGDLIVALGGGVCGDMAGFAAATYLRGMDYVQIPTTFLAAVDSSVGGKTAVDLGEGKNLVGAFHQPIQVICDADTLSTLPRDIFADGSAESIKYGVLGDRDIIEIFSKGKVQDELSHIIARAVKTKSDYVERDEFDNGLRMFLNLGHTAGHAIEKLSGLSITHGHAVAIGMVIVTDAAEKLGICEPGSAAELRQILTRNGLPISTSFTGEEIGRAAQSDKKRRGDSLKLVLPRRIGECMLYDAQADRLGEIFSLSEAVKR